MLNKQGGPKVRTHRYDDRSDEEELYLRRHFSMTCEALGDAIKIRPVTDVSYTNQQEPIYTRTEEYIDGFGLVQATLDMKYLVKGGWMNEDDEFKPILVHIPVVYDYDTVPETLIDLSGEGHLIQSELNERTFTEHTLIASQSRYSDDGTHWIMSIVPYRASGRDEVIPDAGGIKPNYKFLKG